MSRLTTLLIIFGLVSMTMGLSAQRGFPKLSPFESLRPKEKTMEVMVDGRWYELKAINGKSYDAIMDHCREKFRNAAFKRFSEDLVQVLSELKLDPGESVSLDLVDLETKRPVQIREAAMTEANRKAIWQENQEQDRGPLIDLVRSGAIGGEEGRRRRDGESRGRSMTAAQIDSDLRQLEEKLESEYAYLDRGPSDWRERLHRLRIPEDHALLVDQFHIQLREFIALFGDGHSRARGVHRVISGWYPFALVKVQEGWAAFASNGALHDPDFPFLADIEDETPEDLARRIGLVTQGSPSLRTLESEVFMTAASYVDRKNRKPESDVRFKNAAGQRQGRRKKSDIDWVSRPVHKPRPLPRDHAMLENGTVGYLRIASMDSERDFLRRLENQLEAYREAPGLIIDLRGNGGGSRAALELMLPRFLKSGERRVANWAIYKLPKGVEDDPQRGHLSNRQLWPLESEHWSDEVRAFLAKQHAAFKPAWQPKDREGFSSWHAMLVTGTGENAHQKVAVLIDRFCFSATDVFAGAFAELPQVTLIGETTSGGSGRAQSFQLACSGIQIKLSTMVSYRPDGRLYDGAGIEPDIEVFSTLDDWLGKSDSELARALEFLKD